MRVVFIGDYFDCFENIPTSEQIENFNNIIALKKAQPEKFIVLIGNHDYQYMVDGERYSGYQTNNNND